MPLKFFYDNRFYKSFTVGGYAFLPRKTFTEAIETESFQYEIVNSVTTEPLASRHRYMFLNDTSRPLDFKVRLYINLRVGPKRFWFFPPRVIVGAVVMRMDTHDFQEQRISWTLPLKDRPNPVWGDVMIMVGRFIRDQKERILIQEAVNTVPPDIGQNKPDDQLTEPRRRRVYLKG